ncbi:MAG: MarR family transcriptional regulator [Bacillota bacterium]|nr:MarR family transcriptional regulator [Bacillota bacterium]HHU60379.1 MarR family transcriptional regulator [Natronincola sp.]
MKKCPDEYLGRWFSVLHRLSLRHATQGLKKFNIGSGQIMFLLELYYSDGVRQEDLSTFLNIDGANTTRAIKKLEEVGYVVRKQDPDDGRAYRVFLTERAMEVKDDLFDLMRSWDNELLSALDEEEQDIFLKLLKKIGHSFAEHDRCIFCEWRES